MDMVAVVTSREISSPLPSLISGTGCETLPRIAATGLMDCENSLKIVESEGQILLLSKVLFYLIEHQR